MQERYLGDSHDFVKYALLRGMSRYLGLRIGLNWYLTLPELVDRPNSKDGEKRHHLTQPVWRNWDKDLVVRLAHFSAPDHRSLEAFASRNILPADTVYACDPVPVRKTERKRWFSDSIRMMEECGMVFMDPDNGFEVKSMTPRRSPKYALYDEVWDVRASEKVVFVTQFARQTDPIGRARHIRELACREFAGDRTLPVLRARVAPNLLVTCLAPAHLHRQIDQGLLALTNASEGKLELVR